MLTIICYDHGEFKQTAQSHIQGKGCPTCGRLNSAKNWTKKALETKFRHIYQPHTYKKIPLSKGKFAIVDNEDFERVKSINWHFINGYADNSRFGFLHRFILNYKGLLMVDHINGNPLDNRKSNLRLVTRAQNLMNTKPQVNKSSKYKGVYFSKNTKKWISRIIKDGVHYSLGVFTNEIEAAKTYDEKAIELFGEYARLNFKNARS